ncbi:Mitochondrial tRNAs modification protein [Cryptotrichosporon argae]
MTPARLTVLALESSADDSCAAVVDSARRIHANVVIKQHGLNEVHGGIHPIAAHEAHLVNIPRAIAQCLSESRLALSDIDAIAYTRGPGMYGPLSVCAASARALAAATGKPLIGVHHMQAHALTPLLTEPAPPAFPFLTLLVSGGHTMLVLARAADRFEVLATSLDSAMGDAMDKFARALSLRPHPARGLGASLEAHAALPPLPPYSTAPLAPLPAALSTNASASLLAFSFAGLLSAAERRLHALAPRRLQDGLGEPEKREMSRVFQDAAVGHVVSKTEGVLDLIEGRAQGLPAEDGRDGKAKARRKAKSKSASKLSPAAAKKAAQAEAAEARRQAFKDDPVRVTGLVVSGGVGSNLFLRSALKEMLDRRGGGVGLFCPPVALCTDNAAMIAWAAIVRLEAGLMGEPAALAIRKKWPLDALYDDVPAACYRPAQGEGVGGGGGEGEGVA